MNHYLITGYAQLDLNGNVTRSPLWYTITGVDSQGTTFSETMPVLFTTNSHGTPDSFVNQATLVIPSNTLLPRNAYRFKFTASDAFNNSGFVEVDIKTQSVPVSGGLHISPQNGSPLKTIFSLSALRWTDDFGDVPLLYQFGLRYIFFGSTELSTSLLLPPCCNLQHENNFPIGQLESFICVCDFWSTGISEQNDLLTSLPLQPQGRGEVTVQTELLVRVFDRNGARTESSQRLSSFITEQLQDGSEEDTTQPLQPLLDSRREQVDVLALLDNITQLSEGSWREALAQLTTLVSSVEVNSFMRSSYFNLSLAKTAQFKQRAMELVLEIYESYIPITKSYLNVILGLLRSTTSSLDSYEISLDEALISRIINFLRILIDFYNNFSKDLVFSPSGFSTSESQTVVEIIQSLIQSNSNHENNSSDIIRVQADSVAQTLLSLIPKLGFGLCMSEEHSFVNGAGVSLLKASKTNLPMGYQSTEQCNTRQTGYRKKTKFCLEEDRAAVMVDFNSALFEHYLWWLCAAATGGNDDDVGSYCSGVCLTSAQHTQNLLWQGSPYESQTKSLLFQLYLLNPLNGSVLEVSTATESPTREARDVASVSDQIDLTFPILASYSNASNLQCAHWNGTSRTWLTKTSCSSEILEKNGIVTDIICHCGTPSGSIFTILEICPSGHYGETCSYGKKTLCVCVHVYIGPNILRTYSVS